MNSIPAAFENRAARGRRAPRLGRAAHQAARLIEGLRIQLGAHGSALGLCRFRGRALFKKTSSEGGARPGTFR
jgi:hypothetical protein